MYLKYIVCMIRIYVHTCTCTCMSYCKCTYMYVHVCCVYIYACVHIHVYMYIKAVVFHSDPAKLSSLRHFNSMLESLFDRADMLDGERLLYMYIYMYT